MRTIACDVAIIGAGTAGLGAQESASEAGAKALLIEQGPGGTTCAATGCMPSKLLIAAADAAARMRHLDLFGLRLDGRLVVEGQAVFARLRRERDHFVRGVLDSVAEIPKDRMLRGRARFLGPTRLAVDGDDGETTEIEARAVVIATGSRPSLPKPFRDLGSRVLTNETVFELPDLPASLAVIGAGPLGIELAQAFGRLGTQVIVFDQGDTIAGLDDPAARGKALEILGAELDIRLGTEVRPKPAADRLSLTWTGEDPGTRIFENVLVAAGRPPNLDGLDLDKAGLALDEHGVPVFDQATLRCGDSAVFIAGDADHDRPVLHEASAEGAIAGRNAALPAQRSGRRNVPFAITYTDPEIVTVGPRFPALGDVAIGEIDLAQSGRARVMGRNAGLIRIYAAREGGRLLGGVLIGPEAEHLGHLLAFMVEAGMTADAALALPYYHPTLEESLRAAIRKICGQIRTRTEWRGTSLEYGPGS